MIYIGSKEPYECLVSQGKIPGSTYIRKFGRMPATANPISSRIDIWEGGNVAPNTEGTIYPWDVANAPMYICSNNAADTNIDIRVVGQVSDGTYADIGDDTEEVITLQGTTVLPLANNYLHVFRAANISCITNFPGSGLTGIVYIFRGGSASGGVPTNGSDVRAIINDGFNKTQMAVWAVPHQKVAMVRAGEVCMNYAGSGAFASEAAARVGIRAYQRGSSFSTLEKGVDLISVGGSYYTDRISFPEPVPAGGKVVMSVENSTEAMGFTAEFELELIDESKFDSAWLSEIQQPGY